MKQLKTYAVVFTSRIAAYDEIDTETLLENFVGVMEFCSKGNRYLINCSSIELKEIKND